MVTNAVLLQNLADIIRLRLKLLTVHEYLLRADRLPKRRKNDAKNKRHAKDSSRVQKK